MFLRKRLPNGRDVPWNSPDGGGGEGSPRGGDGDQPIVNRRSTRASSLPPGNAMSRRRSPEWFARHGVQAMRDAWEQEIADMDPEDREDIMQNRLDRQTEAAGYEGRETEIVRNDRVQMKRVAASDEYTSASQARSSGTRIDGDSEAASQAPVPIAVRPPKAPPPTLNRDVTGYARQPHPPMEYSPVGYVFRKGSLAVAIDDGENKLVIVEAVNPEGQIRYRYNDHPSIICSTHCSHIMAPTMEQVVQNMAGQNRLVEACLLYTSPSPRDGLLSRMPSSA